MFDETPWRRDEEDPEEVAWRHVLGEWTRQLQQLANFVRKNPQYQVDLEGNLEWPFSGLKLVGLEYNVTGLRQSILGVRARLAARHPYCRRITTLPVP